MNFKIIFQSILNLKHKIVYSPTQLDFSLEKGFQNNFVVFFKANNLLNTPYQLYVKKPLLFPEDPYPYQTDPTNVGFVRRDLYGIGFRLGVRYSIN